jgi:S-methylmethionine-dependent homocysteine/selenocysteine methylase
MNTLNEDANIGDSTRTKMGQCANDYDEEGLTPDAYSQFACQWARLGARIICGCCGCRPQHIHKVASALNDFK